eukprot:NODE_6512_length_563_cov_2.815175_g6097_i0.p1 GENE.NODE_6512_length_563_cov_2.815175_g6097_i0~~NODE_6512_length_563_cov_2.815175_g6097_i0.p1  ORF type:complete len:101 (-),score=1.27 NODE_6512_length_563_cov_2.815175_g6097_i0:9-311(-)
MPTWVKASDTCQPIGSPEHLEVALELAPAPNPPEVFAPTAFSCRSTSSSELHPSAQPSITCPGHCIAVRDVQHRRLSLQCRGVLFAVCFAGFPRSGVEYP